MKSVVTGGKGFIGSKIVRKLLDNGDKVIILDRDVDGSRIIHPNAAYIDVDLVKHDIKHYLNGIDRIFHLAADISVQDSIERPYDVSFNNSISTLKILEACRIMGVKRIVFSSTCAVYENKSYAVYSEHDKTNPLNAYSISKLYGENLFKMYTDMYGLEGIILRYFNVYGSITNTNQYSAVINKFVSNFRKCNTLSIFGDGKQTRDFIHVDDVVNANICASQVDLKKYGEVFNIGTGIETSILDLAKMLQDDIKFEESKLGEIRNSCADVTKSKRGLKWESKIKLEDWIRLIK